MSLKDFADAAKHAIFTDDDPKNKKAAPSAAKPVTPAPAVAPTPATVPNFGFGSAAAGAAYGVAPVVTENTEVYSRIVSKTDFDQTQAGQILNKYLAPLANIPLDPSMKLKTAVAQAVNDGLTVEKVLATFDGLKVALQNEVQAFNDAASGQTDHEVTARTTRIQQIQQQIADLNTQLQQLSNDLVAAQSKISTATQQFSMAASRRGIELDQQKAQYAAMLKG
jgi:hypothetical protein